MIDVVAGPDFGPSAAVLRIQAVTVLAVFALVPWSYALLSLRRHGAVLAITLTTLAVNATLVSVLASSHGARGAAVGTLVADVVALVVTGAYLARSSTLRPQFGVVLRMVPALALAGAVWFVPGLPSVVAMVLGAVVYGVVLLVLRAVPDEVFVELRKLRGSPAT